jgi:hypothetical protein
VTISKQRRAKRKQSHYKTKVALFILEGGHPDWVPGNNYGNLSQLNHLCRDLKAGLGYVTQPKSMWGRVP